MRILGFAAFFTLGLNTAVFAGVTPAGPVTTSPIVSSISIGGVGGSGGAGIILVTLGANGQLLFNLRR